MMNIVRKKSEKSGKRMKVGFGKNLNDCVGNVWKRRSVLDFMSLNNSNFKPHTNTNTVLMSTNAKSKGKEWLWHKRMSARLRSTSKILIYLVQIHQMTY
jgi:hypothetical protein